jgi:hypothetical protein
MKTYEVSLPQLAFVAATRGMAGAGLGLLLSDQMRLSTRRKVGWSLLAVGALTTVPIAWKVFSRR